MATAVPKLLQPVLATAAPELCPLVLAMCGRYFCVRDYAMRKANQGSVDCRARRVLCSMCRSCWPLLHPDAAGYGDRAGIANELQTSSPTQAAAPTLRGMPVAGGIPRLWQDISDVQRGKPLNPGWTLGPAEFREAELLAGWLGPYRAQSGQRWRATRDANGRRPQPV